MLQWRLLNVFLCGPKAWRVMEAEHSLARSFTRESTYVHQGLRCACEAEQISFSLSLSFMISVSCEGREEKTALLKQKAVLLENLTSVPHVFGSLGTFHVNYTVRRCRCFSFGIDYFGKQIVIVAWAVL